MDSRTRTNPLKTFFTGDFSRHTMLTILLPLYFFAYYGTMFVSFLFFPYPYDWRFLAISGLISVYGNPNGWYFFAGGMIVFSILLIPIAGYLYRKLHVICQRTAAIGTFSLLLAALGNFLLGTIVYTPSNLMYHFISAIFYALGFLTAFLCYWLIMMKDRLPRFHGKRQFNRRLMDWALVMILFAVCGMAISQGIRFMIEGTFDVSNDWPFKGIPYVLSFGVWEWILFTFFNIHLILSVCMIPKVVEPLEPTPS